MTVEELANLMIQGIAADRAVGKRQVGVMLASRSEIIALHEQLNRLDAAGGGDEYQDTQAHPVRDYCWSRIGGLGTVLILVAENQSTPAELEAGPTPGSAENA